jgi:hypothetical protein
MLIPPSGDVMTSELPMHVSQGSIVDVTAPFMQYSVAHCDWHIPLAPQSHAWMSLTRFMMPAMWMPWQHETQALPVDIAAQL